MPSQLSRQSVRLLTDWSQVRALSTALLGPQLSQVERPAHNRKAMGSNPIGPMLTKNVFVYYAPVVQSGQSFRPFEPKTRVRIPAGAFKKFVKIFNGFCFTFVFQAGVPERPKGTGLGPVDAGLPGFKSLLPHLTIFLFLSYLNAGVGQAVILRDCGSRDSGSNLGSGPIYKTIFSYYFSNALSFYLYRDKFRYFN